MKKKLDIDKFISDLNREEQKELLNKLVLKMDSLDRMTAWPENICRECLCEMTPIENCGNTQNYTCWGCYESRE